MFNSSLFHVNQSAQSMNKIVSNGIFEPELVFNNQESLSKVLQSIRYILDNYATNFKQLKRMVDFLLGDKVLDCIDPNGKHYLLFIEDLDDVLVKLVKYAENQHNLEEAKEYRSILFDLTKQLGGDHKANNRALKHCIAMIDSEDEAAQLANNLIEGVEHLDKTTGYNADALKMYLSNVKALIDRIEDPQKLLKPAKHQVKSKETMELNWDSCPLGGIFQRKPTAWFLLQDLGHKVNSNEVKGKIHRFFSNDMSLEKCFPTHPKEGRIRSDSF